MFEQINGQRLARDIETDFRGSAIYHVYFFHLRVYKDNLSFSLSLSLSLTHTHTHTHVYVYIIIDSNLHLAFTDSSALSTALAASYLRQYKYKNKMHFCDDNTEI